MFRWLYILPHLLTEANAARRDAGIRFLKAQVEILRRKLGGNRALPRPDDRARLLAGRQAITAPKSLQCPQAVGSHRFDHHQELFFHQQGFNMLRALDRTARQRRGYCDS